MKRFGSQLSCRISSDMLRRAPISRAYALVGKLVWKSLKTATFSVAKQRLPDTLRDHRSKIESLTAFAEGKMTSAMLRMFTCRKYARAYYSSRDQKNTVN